MVLCAFAHPTADSSCFSLVSAPEVWLRGAVPDVPPLLQPVAHSLLQCREEMAALLPALSSAEIAARPGGAASAGYHARHAIGSIDRLLTYARGEALSAAQMQVLAAEKTEDMEPGAGMRLLARYDAAIEGALKQIRETSDRTLLETRAVGRARLPSTVLGLLFHVAEHTQRHAGQLATTAKVVRGTSR